MINLVFHPVRSFLLSMVAQIQARAQNKTNALLDLPVLKGVKFPVESLDEWLVVDDVVNCHSKIDQGIFVEQVTFLISTCTYCTAGLLL